MQNIIYYTLICLEGRSCRWKNGFQRVSQCWEENKRSCPDNKGYPLIVGRTLAIGKRTPWHIFWTLFLRTGEMRGMFDGLRCLRFPFSFHCLIYLFIFFLWQSLGLDVFSDWLWWIKWFLEPQEKKSVLRAVYGFRRGFCESLEAVLPEPTSGLHKHITTGEAWSSAKGRTWELQVPQDLVHMVPIFYKKFKEIKFFYRSAVDVVLH